MDYQQDTRPLNSLTDEELRQIILSVFDNFSNIDWNLLGNQQYIQNLLDEVLRRKEQPSS